jgi:beta-lactamase regulating signal transducer with metallopeptidase domain
MSYTDTVDLVVRSLGWALLHSLWQGALVGGLVALLLSILKARSPQARYVVACLGLAAMIAAWIGTAVSTNRALAPTVAARALRVAFEPTIELGPAGPDDRTPAIRVFETRESLDRVGPPVPWAQRLEQSSWLLVPLWLVGVGLLSARLALSWIGVARLRRAQQAPVPSAVAERMAILAVRLRIRRVVRIVQSAAVQVPLVVGWLRPIVMLPASALTGLSPEQLEAIIAHELAHVRRHDHLINALQSAAEVLLYYHPACWWISRRIRVEREHCCDDIAVALCGDGVAYAAALAELETQRSGVALALAATDGTLLLRVRRLIGQSADPARPWSWAGSAAPIAVIAVLVAGAQAAGQSARGDAVAGAPTVSRSVPGGEAVLQGRVVEANSARPVPDASVQAMGSEGAAQTRTGENGTYELAGLKPGNYTLLVKAPGFVETYYGKTSSTVMDFGTQVTAAGGRVTSGLDVRVQPAGSISGRITDAKGRGLPGVEVELVRSGARLPAAGAAVFAQTIEDGTYRMRDVSPGDYVVRAYANRNLRPAEGGPAAAYTVTLYPGVTDVGSAQPLRIYAGQELLDVDFALATSRKFRITGRVVDPGGPASGVGVMLHPMGPSGLPGGENKVVPDAEGRFEIKDILPGTYMLGVMDPRRTMRWVSGQRLVTIDGDLLDVELRAALGATIEGRVTRDAGAAGTLDFAGVFVGFDAPVEGQRGGFTGTNFPVGREGTFSLESPGGQAQFRVKRLPPGWMVKSVSLDGGDIDDSLMDFGSGTRHLAIVLTDKVTSVAGVVVDRNGRPLTNYSVVLFPPDRSRWHANSNALVMARSDNAGRFRVEAVPPGTYLAVAVAGLPMGGWQEPAILEKLESSAETIRLGEGQQLTISIRAVATPPGLGAVWQWQQLLLTARTAASRVGVNGRP